MVLFWLVWQRSLSDALSLDANASVFHRTIDAYSVVNQYPTPVPYSAPREALTSGTMKLNAVARFGAGWQVQLSNVYLAPDLLPQGRIGSRYSLDVGIKKSVQQGMGEIVLNATDLLNTNQAERTIRGAGFRVVSTDYLETQVIRVGYSRKF